MSDEGGPEEAATATSAAATLSTPKWVRLTDTWRNLAEVTSSADAASDLKDYFRRDDAAH